MSKRDVRQNYFQVLEPGRLCAQTARNVNAVWAKEASTNAQYNVGSKSFVSATLASKTNHMAAVDSDPLKAPVEADPRKTILPRVSTSVTLQLFAS
ncbi:unnamed protein product [Heligmosomoides polygyrus]|uniref:Uncharacterized protein n=1 Tax=Heligmosomoides polygyrus TaxID=6339 RepID=A0A183FES4_HELPZ|nr:unnamed protein product [Heligmosomoides polygyrus]